MGAGAKVGFRTEPRGCAGSEHQGGPSTADTLWPARATPAGRLCLPFFIKGVTRLMPRAGKSNLVLSFRPHWYTSLSQWAPGQKGWPAAKGSTEETSAEAGFTQTRAGHEGGEAGGAPSCETSRRRAAPGRGAAAGGARASPADSDLKLPVRCRQPHTSARSPAHRTADCTGGNRTVCERYLHKACTEGEGGARVN